MICKLSTPRHFNFENLNLVPRNDLKSDFKGSYCVVTLEPNEYASERHGERHALVVTVNGLPVGYIPELASVASWKGVESDWYKDVERVRDQLFTDYDSIGKTIWSAHVESLRYKSVDGSQWKDYIDVSVMPPEEQEDWKIDAIAIRFYDGM